MACPRVDRSSSCPVDARLSACIEARAPRSGRKYGGTMKTLKKPALLIAAVAMAAVSLTACGSDDEKDPSKETSSKLEDLASDLPTDASDLESMASEVASALPTDLESMASEFASDLASALPTDPEALQSMASELATTLPTSEADMQSMLDDVIKGLE